MSEQLHIATLPNGVRVVVDHVPWHSNTYVTATSFGGASAELPGEDGIAHFFEHLLSEGTLLRTREELWGQLRKRTDSLNLTTSPSSVSMYAEVLSKRLEEAFSIISECFTSPTFPEDRIDIERSRITAEFHENFDNPYQVYFLQHVLPSAFNKQKISKPVLGTLDNISRFSSKDCINFHRRNFVGSNIIVYVAGPEDPGKVTQLAAEMFANIPNGEPHQPEKVVFTPGQKSYMAHDQQLQIINILFRIPGPKQTRLATCEMYNYLLNSYLGERFKEAGGGYSTGTGIHSTPDDGYLNIQYSADTSTDQIYQNTKFVTESLQCFANHLNDQETLIDAQERLAVNANHIKGSLPHRYQETMISYEIDRQLLSVEERHTEIQNVAVEDLITLHRTIIGSLPSIVSMGPSTDIPTPEQIHDMLASRSVPRPSLQQPFGPSGPA